MEIAPGTLVAGKYQVERALAEGGMGVVYLARHVELGAPVAMKVLRTEVLKDPEAVARFRREAQIASTLRSRHVARVLDFGQLPEGAPFMVLEFLDGRDLGAELEARGALPVREAVGWVLQACEAMDEAHRAGVIHRDLKPANLFLAVEGQTRSVKVLDFGISRIAGPEMTRMTQTQSAFGTPLYMSPEQIRSAKRADERSDVWSLGVILYELLTGTLPFIAESATGLAVAINLETPPPMRAHRPDLPAALDAIVERTLVKDPAQRIGSVLELAQLLRAALEHPDVPPQSLRSVSLVDVAPPSQGPAAHARTQLSSVTNAPQAAPPKRGGALRLASIGLGVGVAIGAAVVLSQRFGGSEQATPAGPGPDPAATSRSAEPVEPGVLPTASAADMPATASASAPASAAPTTASGRPLPAPTLQPTVTPTAEPTPAPTAAPTVNPLPGPTPGPAPTATASARPLRL